MSGSLFFNKSQSSDHKESSFLLSSAFRRLKRGSRSLSTTEIIASSAGVQAAGQVMGHTEKAKDPASLVPHSDDLSQAPSLLVNHKQGQKQPHSDHNLLQPTYDQAPTSDRLHGTPDSGYHSEHTSLSQSQTTRQQQLPHPSPLGTGTMPVPVPASAPTVSLSFSSSQLQARHERRVASASAAQLGFSPLSESGGEEPKLRPKMYIGGTLSRHTLQRTRTTDMLLSPTLTLARPSSVVLPPLPPIALNPPPVRLSIHPYPPLILIPTQNCFYTCLCVVVRRLGFLHSKMWSCGLPLTTK
jgi:hypothetical protein